MQRRPWDAKANARIVLEALQGTPVAELCHEHQINQRPYDPGRDHFLANASQAFAVHPDAQQAARLARENAR